MTAYLGVPRSGLSPPKVTLARGWRNPSGGRPDPPETRDGRSRGVSNLGKATTRNNRYNRSNSCSRINNKTVPYWSATVATIMQVACLLGRTQQTGKGGFVRCFSLTQEPEGGPKIDFGCIGPEVTRDLNELDQWRNFVKIVMTFTVR